MRALVIYCHPRAESFTAAVRDLVLGRLIAAGAEYRLTDLYASGFDPCLTARDLDRYEDISSNAASAQEHVDTLAWCATLIFIYPTWWYGLPAMLKGWLDRTMLPGIAFHMPAGPGETIRPGLGHIRRMGVFTTCGASRWLTFVVGAPGKRTLMRGIGFLCGPRCRKVFVAHYLMDSSSDDSRRRHLDRVGRKMDRLIAGAT